MLKQSRPTSLSDDLIRRVVHDFYSRVRSDPVLGKIFETELNGSWNAHMSTMTDFWSSVLLQSGRYAGKPHIAHQRLDLDHSHFLHWLELFEETVSDLCEPNVAALFVDRARRIADSLEIGLNIGPKALKVFAGLDAPTSTPGKQ